MAKRCVSAQHQLEPQPMQALLCINQAMAPGGRRRRQFAYIGSRDIPGVHSSARTLISGSLQQQAYEPKGDFDANLHAVATPCGTEHRRVFKTPA